MTDCVFNSLKQTQREPIVSVCQLKVLAHAQEEREGPDETLGVYYYSSGVHNHFPFPPASTQKFSEYRNSHTGIPADWFSVHTIMGGVTHGGEMKKRSRQQESWVHRIYERYFVCEHVCLHV